MTRGEWSEEDLIKALKANKEVAIREMIDRFGDRLLRGTFMLLGDYQKAEDIVQETFLAALRGIHSFRRRSGLYMWLYRIALNECRMYLRKKQPLVLHELPDDALVADTVETVVLAQETRMQFTAILAGLPYIYREVLILHYYLDLSVNEISAMSDSPIGTVKSRLKRGRDMVEARLQEVRVREVCGQLGK